MREIVLEAPGSKSFTHRAMIAAALAEGESLLGNWLECEDTARTMEILTMCGAGFAREGHELRIHGLGGAPNLAGKPPLDCFAGESGSTCRLLPAALAAGQGSFVFHGGSRLHERPLAPLIKALRRLGARVNCQGREGFAPFTLEATGFSGQEAEVDSSDSSQFLSGLLLAAPLHGLTVTPTGTRLASYPYILLTLQVMRDFGAECRLEELREGGRRPAGPEALSGIQPEQMRFAVSPGGYRGRRLLIEGDYSAAAPLLAAGAIGHCPVTLRGLNPESLQGDKFILDILRKMGAEVRWLGRELLVSPGRLRGLELDLGACPDLVPTVLALAARADGPTSIRNAGQARLKESDRLSAPAAELSKLGCTIAFTQDSLTLTPPAHGLKPPSPGTVLSTHNDHRLAMAFMLLGLPGPSGAGFTPRLDNPGCVNKSYPGFWEAWRGVTGAGTPA